MLKMCGQTYMIGKFGILGDALISREPIQF